MSQRHLTRRSRLLLAGFLAAGAVGFLVRAKQPQPPAYVRVIGNQVTLIKRIDPLFPHDVKKSPSYVIWRQAPLKPDEKSLIDAMNELSRRNGTANCAGAGPNKNEIVFSSATGSTAVYATARAKELAADYLAPDAIMVCAVWPQTLPQMGIPFPSAPISPKPSP